MPEDASWLDAVDTAGVKAILGMGTASGQDGRSRGQDGHSMLADEHSPCKDCADRETEAGLVVDGGAAVPAVAAGIGDTLGAVASGVAEASPAVLAGPRVCEDS